MTLTSDALLDLDGVATRVDAFRFDLVDTNLNPIGANLNVGLSPPVIQLNTQQTVFWSIQGFTLYEVNPSDINIFADRVKVTMILQDGTEFDCGVFAFGTVPKARKQGGIWTPSMFDDSFFLDQAIDTPISIPVGGSVLQAFVNVAASYGITTINLIGVSDQLSTEPLTWLPGQSTGYAAMRGMAAILGAFPPFFDASHVLTLKAPPRPGDTNVDHVYDVNTHVVKDTPVLTNDLYQLPNRWIVFATSQNSSIVGVYDLPATAPTSAANRGGKIVSKSSQLSGLPLPGPGESLQEAANDAARTVALQDPTVYEKATWDTTADPRHGVFDTVLLYGDRYLETGWTLPCKSGAVMTHSAIRLYD